MITLNLPLPPSTNELFFNLPKGGRAKTRAYESWIEEAGWELKRQKQKPVKGRVSIEYLVSEDTGCDLGNLEKAATDLLVTHNLIEGDSRKIVREITMRWRAGMTGIQVLVRPTI